MSWMMPDQKLPVALVQQLKALAQECGKDEFEKGQIAFARMLLSINGYPYLSGLRESQPLFITTKHRKELDI